jgi:hypothetical protein
MKLRTASDERVAIFADQIDVLTASSIQLELYGNTQLIDLDCDFTSLNTGNGNTAMIFLDRWPSNSGKQSGNHTRNDSQRSHLVNEPAAGERGFEVLWLPRALRILYWTMLIMILIFLPHEPSMELCTAT